VLQAFTESGVMDDALIEQFQQEFKGRYEEVNA